MHQGRLRRVQESQNESQSNPRNIAARENILTPRIRSAVASVQLVVRAKIAVSIACIPHGSEMGSLDQKVNRTSSFPYLCMRQKGKSMLAESVIPSSASSSQVRISNGSLSPPPNLCARKKRCLRVFAVYNGWRIQGTCRDRGSALYLLDE